MRSLRACQLAVGLIVLTAAPAPAKVESARTDFRQCLNDSDDNGVKDDCFWSTGASVPANSAYREGDVVGHRLLLVYAVAGTHTIDLVYDFTKSDIYAYDFLSRVDATQAGVLLNQCGGMPSFVTQAMCGSLFSGGVSVPIPSDPFGNVAGREGEGNRTVRVGGSSSPPVVTIVKHTPAAACEARCRTSQVSARLTVATATGNAPIAIWFGAHLASSSAAPAGWGLNRGAASIFGAPFHVAYNGALRTNQIMIGVDPPPDVPEAPRAVLLLATAAIVPLVIIGRRRRAALAQDRLTG